MGAGRRRRGWRRGAGVGRRGDGGRGPRDGEQAAIVLRAIGGAVARRPHRRGALPGMAGGARLHALGARAAPRRRRARGGGRAWEALAEAEEARVRFGSDADLAIAHARLLCARGRADEAAAPLECALAADADAAAVARALRGLRVAIRAKERGNAEYAAGNFHQAEAEYTAALEADGARCSRPPSSATARRRASAAAPTPKRSSISTRRSRATRARSSSSSAAPPATALSGTAPSPERLRGGAAARPRQRGRRRGRRRVRRRRRRW